MFWYEMPENAGSSNVLVIFELGAQALVASPIAMAAMIVATLFST
jgi:hypothetical protein